MNICKDFCKDCGDFFEVKIAVGSIAKFDAKKNNADFTSFIGTNSNVFEEDMEEMYKELFKKYSANNNVIVIPFLFDTICKIPKRDFKHKYIKLTTKTRPGIKLFNEIEQQINVLFEKWLEANI